MITKRILLAVVCVRDNNEASAGNRLYYESFVDGFC